MGMVSSPRGLPHTQLCWGWWALAPHCASSRQGEAAGLAGLPAGEEQTQYHHGVIPSSAAGTQPARGCPQRGSTCGSGTLSPGTGIKGRNVVGKGGFPKVQGLFWKGTKVVGHP